MFDLRQRKQYGLTGLSPEMSVWRTAAFLPGRDILLVTDETGTVFEYDLLNRAAKILPIHPQLFDKVIASADGKLLFMTWMDRSGGDRVFKSRLLDAESGAELPTTIPADWGATWQVAESENHQKLAYVRRQSGSDNLIIVDLAVPSFSVTMVNKHLLSHMSINQTSGSFSPGEQKILLNPKGFGEKELLEIH